MKSYSLVLLLLPLLSGCGLGIGFLMELEDYLKQDPPKYLMNHQGQFINLKREVVEEPIINPYYTLYHTELK